MARSGHMPQRLPAATVRFAAGDGGSASIYMLLMSILMFGILGLVIDSGRAYVAHSQMQDFIDDVALAAADELDGTEDALDRARAVIDGARFAKGSSIGVDGEFAVGEALFLTSAPVGTDGRLDPGDYAGLVTDSPFEATHVLLTAEPRDVPWGLLNITRSGGSDGDGDAQGGVTRIAAWAAAGSVRDFYCVEPLVAVCLPPDGLEAVGPGVQLMADKNRDGFWRAGEYGPVIGIADDTAASCSDYGDSDARLACLLALDTHDTVCRPARVDFTGDRTVPSPNGKGRDDTLALHTGLNRRFGLAADGAEGLPGSVDVNHITGLSHMCSGTVEGVPSVVQPPPRASCLAAGDCDGAAPVPDEGSLAFYWERAHGVAELPELDDAGDGPGRPVTTPAEAYLYELRNALLDPEGAPGERVAAGPRAQCLSDDPKEGAPQPGRRLVEIALVDCGGLTDPAQVEQPGAPVAGFAEALLSAPLDPGAYFIADFDGSADPDAPGSGPLRAGDTLNPAQGGGAVTPYDGQGLSIWAVAELPEALQAAGQGAAVLFDTQEGWGAAPDLRSTAFGNAAVVPVVDGAPGPAPFAGPAMLVLRFDDPADVGWLRLLGGGAGSELWVWGSALSPSTLLDAAPRGAEALAESAPPDVILALTDVPAGGHLTVPVGADPQVVWQLLAGGISPDGVGTLAVRFGDAPGALDAVAFRSAEAVPNRGDRLLVEITRMIGPDDRRALHFPELAN